MSDLPTREEALNVHATFEGDRFVLSLDDWRIVQHITHEYGSERLQTRQEIIDSTDWEMMSAALFEWAVDEMENVSLPDGTQLANLFAAALGEQP
jgi:hypothetical protein